MTTPQLTWQSATRMVMLLQPKICRRKLHLFPSGVCFVRKIIVSLPLDKDGEDQLDDFDLYDYEKSLANAFIELDDDGKALLTGEA